jgi:hypothetical protein
MLVHLPSLRGNRVVRSDAGFFDTTDLVAERSIDGQSVNHDVGRDLFSYQMPS